MTGELESNRRSTKPRLFSQASDRPLTELGLGARDWSGASPDAEEGHPGAALSYARLITRA